MEVTIPSRSDVPAAVVMAVLFLSFGLFAVLLPKKLRAATDNFANSWKEGSWQPYRMLTPVLRFVVRRAGFGGGALLLYIAYVGFTR